MDFNETFAPMAKFIIFRCILTLGMALDWKNDQMEVKIISLNGILEVEITWINWRVLYKRRRNTLCAKSGKLCTGLSNRRGHSIYCSYAFVYVYMLVQSWSYLRLYSHPIAKASPISLFWHPLHFWQLLICYENNCSWK